VGFEEWGEFAAVEFGLSGAVVFEGVEVFE